MTLLAIPAGLVAERVTAALLSLLLAGVTAAPARDEIRDQQWHLDFLDIEEAHTISTGEGVIVGVVDTGVDGGHPDLTGTLLPGADFTVLDRADAWEDLDGHGTAMAGLIGAHGRALGVAPAASILPLRYSTDGPGFSRFAADSIRYAVEHGATILCLAFVFDEPIADVEFAIEQAIASDVVVVAGIGNTPSDATQYPAAYPGVVGAAGIDRDGNHADVSVVSPNAVLAAPAVEITSTGSRTVTPSGYRAGTGTSDATAIIAGVAALIRSRYPELSAEEVIHRMTATADDRGAPGRDDEYGYGIVNPVAALTADIPPLERTDAPTAPPTQPTASGPGHSAALGLVALAGVGIVLLVIVGLVVGLRRRT